MSPRLVRALLAVPLCAVAAAACLENGATQPGPEPDPVIHETARFVIVDYAEVDQAVIDALGARLEADYDRVGAFLADLPFDPPPTPITFTIRRGNGIPFVTPGENAITQWADGLASSYLPHQLTHLYTRYQRTNFIEEGIAVYASEELQLANEAPNPFRGQVPHAWVSLFERHNSTISLFTALRASNLSYNFQGSSPDASAWQMFVEAGSFTRWMIETHGVDQWYEFYLTANLGGVLGDDTPAIERAWLDDATAAHPSPLSCEEALGEVGTREEFWCARARGD